jgi:hypothetical protein
MLNEIHSMGFPKEDALVALQAAQYNPDLAVEFLMNVSERLNTHRESLKCLWKVEKEAK